MNVSDARRAANIANSARSTGPTSTSGKMASRQGSLKHGMSGGGTVLPVGQAEEVQKRIEALTADMKPMSPAGILLITQMAICSVRMDIAAKHEAAEIARNVRHAEDDHDEERVEKAEELFEALAENPRNNLRKLRKSPEGVERLIDAWQDLRADLAIDPKPLWTAEHLEQAGHLLGLHSRHARGSRIGALSQAFWGDFGGLTVEDGGNLDEKARQAWAKTELIAQIDAEISELEAHYLTLDFETIELDRAEAGARALFDTSKKACLARRYESEARRGFFKALKEFRQVEAEFAARAEAAPSRTPAPPAEPKMASFRENTPPPAREPFEDDFDAPDVEFPAVRRVEGTRLTDDQRPRTPC